MDRRAECDLIVVGAGIVGLATTLAAQDRGLTARCFESARPGAGQSAGRTRIFRHRHDSAKLVELAVGARRAWERWEERLGRMLVGDEGVLIVGPDLEEHARRFDDAGAEYVDADTGAQRRALPALGSLGAEALLDLRGGAIRSSDAVDGLARPLGDAIVPAEVLGLHPEAEGLLVHTSEGIWRARHTVLCAGAATARLARPLGLELPVSHGCTLRGTFSVRDAGAAPRLACLLDRRDHVAEALPGLHPEPIGMRLCRTTKLPWGDDAFAAWRLGPVTAFAGNNLFKFAPLLGPLLVESAISGAVAPELTPPAGECKTQA